MKKFEIVLFAISFISILEVSGKENINSKNKSVNQISSAGCAPSTSSADLDIGNVRTKIWINGDMWWDLFGSPVYEVPKNSGKHSLFSGALWIGGYDNANNLKVAAQTYRQSGSDFWPGPMDTALCSVDVNECLFYNKHWKVTRQQVADFINGGAPTQAIIEWPGNGKPNFNESQFLAPFYDNNGDGVYDYTDGDYPKYNFSSIPAGTDNQLNGDQTIWWVFNDIGNIHNETNSLFPIGLEIRAQAYAFCSSDSDLNNATFYSYEIINRCPTVLTQTIFGQFVDADLGYFNDDYVGCDVSRNFGYTINGDNFDEGVTGYGTDLSAVGMDVLQGPLADVSDGTDNDRDGVVDEPGEEILMSKFLYYTNNTGPTGNPTTAQNYYDYMNGKWKNGSEMVYGGTGYQTAGAPICNFMFPGNSDPSHFGTDGIDPGFDWSEMYPCPTCSPDTPSDRRFIMSAGKMTMMPGQVVHITKAAVWAHSPDGVDSSLQKLLRADDKIQTFFDSKFTSLPTCFTIAGIDELHEIKHTVFPSPADDFVTFQLKDIAKSLSVSVFDAKGKLIYNSENKNTGRLKIITSDWSAGNYYYNLKTGDKAGSGKILIIRD